MERRVNYILVSLFSLVMLFGFVAFVLWAHARGNMISTKSYAIYFTQAVSGLNVGSNVTYLGVQSGHVGSIALDTETMPPRVRLVVDIDNNIPVTAGTQARLKPSGITGLYFIDLQNDPTNTAPTDTDKNGLSIIASAPSDIDRLLGGASGSVEKFERLLERTEKLLSDDNLAHLSQLLSNGANAMKELHTALSGINKNGTSDELAAALRETRETARAISTLANTLSEDPSRIIYPQAPSGVSIQP